MLTRFEVQNFRGFEHLAVESLARVNLIAGKNNIGKTALLEAIFLHLGWHNPLLPLRVNSMRGVEWLATRPAEAWGWLFHDRRIQSPIELRSDDSGGQSHTLSIALNWAEQTVEPPAGTLREQSGSYLTTERGIPSEIGLRYQRSDGFQARSRAVIAENGEIRVFPAQEKPSAIAVYLGSTGRSLLVEAEQFSEVERTGRWEAILAALRILEPRLKRVAVLVTGGVPVLHGDLGLSEMMPLPLMGEGMTRLASILLAFVAAKEGGVVLIDEIESGLHHSVLERVFGIVAAAARSYDVQVFATTHSWECIRAAHAAFSAQPPYDFRLHRLEQVKERIKDFAFDAESLEIALKAELEVR